MSKLRALLVTVINEQYRFMPAGNFPTVCPTCGHSWQVGEGWVEQDYGRSGGREAECAVCGCQMFEIIDQLRDKLPSLDEWLEQQKGSRRV